MKKTVFIHIFFLLIAHAFAQHEGIERHFDTYMLDISPYQTDDFTRYDTTLSKFHEVESYYRNSGFGGIRAGNNGQAYLPFNFFEQENLTDFIFFNPYINYTTQTNEIAFYDARKPFTLFQFTGGPHDYEDVLGLFTLNPTPFLNLGLRYNSLKSGGNFIHSEAKIKDFSFWQSYTKKRYQNHLTILHNASNSQEFGGFQNDSIYESGQRIENIPVNLTSAESKTRHQEIKFAHELRLGEMKYDTITSEKDTTIQISHLGKFSLYQDFTFSRNWRLYTDDPVEAFAFYNSRTVNPDETYDSVSQNSIDHNLGIHFVDRSDSVSEMRIYAGVNNKHTKFGLPGKNELTNEYSIQAKLFGNTRQLDYKASAETGLYGRNKGDLLAGARVIYTPDSLKNHIFSASFNFSRLEPNYFYEHYKSNYTHWDQDLGKESTIKSSLTYHNHKREFKLYLRHALINNMVYIPSNGVPTQYNGYINIANAGIGKTFRLGVFGLRSEVCYQYQDKDTAIHLPEVLALAGIFYEDWIFDNHMNLRAGIDARYYTKYYSYAYIPATGFFTLQDEKETGGSPLIDAYLSFKVKRFRAFLRYSNVGQNFLNLKGYSLLHYPDRPGGLHFGISWEFYD